MANFYSDQSEWESLFKNSVDWDSIIPLYYPTFPTPEGFKDAAELKEFFEELIKTTGKWTAESLAPRARELDQVGGGTLKDGNVIPSEVLAKTYAEVVNMDLFGMNASTKFVGMGLPVAVGFFTVAQIARACTSTSSQISFFSGIVDMIERYCSQDIKEKYIPLILQGKISGSMCLTEPDAGSDVGALRTSAEKQPDGTYLINGTKSFITNGGGGLGFVLARVKGAPKGLAGISIFFVEQNIEIDGKPRQNYRVAKIEEKLGLHGSPTCEVVYENTIGRLVGQENEGFKIMLHLMNEARITVGIQGLGGMEASLGAVKEYAATRKQFGKVIAELPLMKRNIDDMQTEVDAFRVLIVDTWTHYDIFQFLEKKQMAGTLTDEELKKFKVSSKIVRKRTPLVKYYGAEAFTLMSTKAIQAFGGYGFMQDYDVERFHRDSFAPLLYEGTSQIQALMAMKDYVKNVIRDPGGFVQRLMGSHPLTAIMKDSEYERSIAGIIYDFRKSVSSLLIKCFKPDLSLSESGMSDTLAQINKVFKMDYWQEEGRFDKLMVHAETLCQGLSYIETLRVLSQAAVKDPTRGNLYHRYYKLVHPRLEGIYADWRQS